MVSYGYCGAFSRDVVVIVMCVVTALDRPWLNETKF